MSPRQALLWQLQPLGRPLVSAALAAVVYGVVLPRSFTLGACAAYAACKLLALLARPLPPADGWLRRLGSEAWQCLVLAAWVPSALPSLIVLLFEVGALIRLRWSRPGRVVVVRQNICYHGFMVMPEIVVNTILTLDRLCGRGHVRIRVDFGEHTMEGGMHPYYSAARGPNVWRYFFEDNLSATDEPDAPPAATFGYLLHSVVHHNGATFLFPHEAGPSTFALPPTWSGREADFGKQPYTRQLHAWYGAQRRAFADVLERIELRPTKPIRDEVERLWRSRFKKGRFVLGVHLRGTDKTHSGGIVYPSAYFPYIDHFLATHRDVGLFVATDSPRFLEEVEARYGERAAHLSCMRDAHNAAWDLRRDGFAKGREVLLDALCLSRCDFLIFSTSGVPELAMRLNPALHDRSLNLSFDGASQFDLQAGAPAALPDAPVPPLTLLGRAAAAATWWPLFMLKNYSDTPLWLLQRRLLSLDVSEAQRDAWSNAEKADGGGAEGGKARARGRSPGERRTAGRASRSPPRRAR